MRQAYAGHRRERPSYSLCMKVSKFQVENKRKLYFHSKYRLFRCQKVSPEPRGKKKAPKHRFQPPAGGSIFLKIAKISAKIADCHNMTYEECIFAREHFAPPFFACRRIGVEDGKKDRKNR